jgi:hypothetical protein
MGSVSITRNGLSWGVFINTKYYRFGNALACVRVLRVNVFSRARTGLRMSGFLFSLACVRACARNVQNLFKGCFRGN